MEDLVVKMVSLVVQDNSLMLILKTPNWIEREGNQEVCITILERIARTEERILALMECQNQHYRQLNMNMKLALETARKSHDARFNDQANNDKNK